DPGVLVLSKFAGAARELDAALQVNPHDIDGMARAIAGAFAMPLSERQTRWEAMMVKLRAGTIQHWFADFVDALQDAHGGDRQPANDRGLPDPLPSWPFRSVAAIRAVL